MKKLSEIKSDITNMEFCNADTRQSNMSNTIVINGIPEKKDESIYDEVVNIINSKVKQNVSISDLNYCYRMGKPRMDKSVRPISVTFVSRRVFSSEKNLKNSGIVISECLSKGNLLLYKKVRAKLGVRQCRTWNGKVYANINGGNHHIRVESDIDKINNK